MTADSGAGDETKPTCDGCRSRGTSCEWGVRLSFRPENAQTVDAEWRNAAGHLQGHTYQVNTESPIHEAPSADSYSDRGRNSRSCQRMPRREYAA